MKQRTWMTMAIGALLALLAAGAAQAVTIETVPVGNLGNTGEWSADGPDSLPIRAAQPQEEISSRA